MIYDFRCTDCGRNFSVERPMGRVAATQVCPWPQCEGRATRVITAPAIKVSGGTKAGYVRR